MKKKGFKWLYLISLVLYLFVSKAKDILDLISKSLDYTLIAVDKIKNYNEWYFWGIFCVVAVCNLLIISNIRKRLAKEENRKKKGKFYFIYLAALVVYLVGRDYDSVKNLFPTLLDKIGTVYKAVLDYPIVLIIFAMVLLNMFYFKKVKESLIRVAKPKSTYFSKKAKKKVKIKYRKRRGKR